MISPHEHHENRTGIVYLLIFMAFAGGILAGGYFAYRTYEQNFRQRAEHQLSAIAELKVDQLLQYRMERFADASIVFENPAFSNLVRLCFGKSGNNVAQHALHVWFAKYKSEYGYDRVILLDTRGVVRMSDSDTPEPLTPTLQNSVAEALVSGEIRWQDFYRDEHDHNIYLALSIPIVDEADRSRPLGVVVLRIDPRTYLYPFIQAWPAPSRTSETLILRREGNEAVFLNELRFQKNTALNLRVSLHKAEIAAVRAVRGEQGVIEAVDYRGVVVLADVRPIPNSPWFMVARMDAWEVYEPIRAQLWLTILAVTALLTAAGASVGMVWRHQRNRFYVEQFRSAETLRESEEILRNSQMIAGLGSYVLDIPSGRWKSTEVLDTLFGIDEKFDRTVQGWADLIHPDDRTMMVDYFGGLVLGQGKVFDKEYRIIRLSDKAERWVHGLGKLEFDADGSPLIMRGTIQDITERKRAEEEIQNLNAELEQRVLERTSELESANKELEAFSYSVSHDLRAPLRSIDGFSQALLEDNHAQLDERGKEHLIRVRNAAQRMGQLIDDILNLSHIQRAELSSVRVDLSDLGDEIMQGLQLSQPRPNVEVLIETGMAAFGDPPLLRVLLQNLLENAWKFTAKRERVKIEFGSRLSDGKRVFFVRDNGAGFEMSRADKLFTPFQRFHSQTEFAGTGIGLSSARRIINRHKGRIWAESEIDKGATMSFTLTDPRSDQSFSDPKVGL